MWSGSLDDYMLTHELPPFLFTRRKKSPFIRMILILFSNYKREQIEEAFAPLEERFE